MWHSPVAIGLLASRKMRTGQCAPLVQFVRVFEPFFRDVLQAHIVAVGSTYDVIKKSGGLHGYPHFERLATEEAGGIVSLVRRVVEPAMAGGVDWIIDLSDPIDPTSLYPEVQALKRQCIVHNKPLFSTVAAASEWCFLEWQRAMGSDSCGEYADALAWGTKTFIRPDNITRETIALVAHDSKKLELMKFADRHHVLLSGFGRRLATGTTGDLLCGRMPARLTLSAAHSGEFNEVLVRLRELSCKTENFSWVDTVQSGPHGGDAQIAAEIIEGRCKRVIFFGDPHVCHEHEADIQLFERASRIPGVSCLWIQSADPADRWATNLERLCSGVPPGPPIGSQK